MANKTALIEIIFFFERVALRIYSIYTLHMSIVGQGLGLNSSWEQINTAKDGSTSKSIIQAKTNETFYPKLSAYIVFRHTYRKATQENLTTVWKEISLKN